MVSVTLGLEVRETSHGRLALFRLDGWKRAAMQLMRGLSPWPAEEQHYRLVLGV